MTFRPFGGKTYTLASSISSTDTTIILTSFIEPVSGVPYTMALLDTDIVYATIAPKTTSSEFISFTGITQNGNGTATLTGVTRGLAKKYPFTASATFRLPHSGQTQFIISNPPQLYNEYVTLDNAETIVGLKTFTTATRPKLTTDTDSSTNEDLVSVGQLNRTAFAGAPDATLTVKGIVEIATTAEIDADTATGSTGASIVARPDQLVASKYGTRLPTANEKSALVGDNTDIAVGTGNKYVTQTGLQKSAEVYAASTTGNDTYVVTLSPVPTSLVNGMTIRFKPDTANTGAATLNVNSLGALAIVTGLSTALVTGDIVANQVVEVTYNSTGTVWQLKNPASAIITPMKASNGTQSATSSTTYTITTSFRPYSVKLMAVQEGTVGGTTVSNGWYDTTTATMGCTYVGYNTNGGITTGGSSTAYSLNITYGSTPTASTAVINNITATSFDIVFTKGTQNVTIYWEAIGF